jgi:hypothetical protein
MAAASIGGLAAAAGPPSQVPAERLAPRQSLM